MDGTEKKRILTHFAQQGLRQSFVRARDTAARGSFYRITCFYFESRPDRNVIMIPQQFQVQILVQMLISDEVLPYDRSASNTAVSAVIVLYKIIYDAVPGAQYEHPNVPLYAVKDTSLQHSNSLDRQP